MQKSRVRKKSQLRKANKQTGTTAASTKTKTRTLKKKKKKKKTQGIFLKDFLQVFVVFLSRKCM